jgi:hypothetical protein
MLFPVIGDTSVHTKVGVRDIFVKLKSQDPSKILTKIIRAYVSTQG